MAKTPDEIVADIDRQQNEEDLDLPRRAASFAKDKYNSLLQAGMGMMGKSPKEDKRLLPEGALIVIFQPKGRVVASGKITSCAPVATTFCQ